MQSGKHDVDVDQQLGSNRAMRILDLSLSLWAEVAVSAAIMALLIVVVFAFALPNPNMILVVGLVVCSTVFGVSGGVTSGLIMLAYTLFFFSTDHDFVTFTSENFMKVLVTAIGATVIAVFVCALKGTEDRALRDVRTLVGLLRDDVVLLEQASTVDTLTGLRNRFSLRRDYPSYADEGAPLHVLMLDLDDFKRINDTHGHERGDAVLTDVGAVLLDIFGPKHAYRYGGDEFLIIVPEWTDGLFHAACEELRSQMEALTFGSDAMRVMFSGGYVSGTPHYQSDLRLMIRQADDKLYHAKRMGKNTVMGGTFDRSVAERLEVNGRSVRYGDRQ